MSSCNDVSFFGFQSDGNFTCRANMQNCPSQGDRLIAVTVRSSLSGETILAVRLHRHGLEASLRSQMPSKKRSRIHFFHNGVPLDKLPSSCTLAKMSELNLEAVYKQVPELTREEVRKISAHLPDTVRKRDVFKALCTHHLPDKDVEETSIAARDSYDLAECVVNQFGAPHYRWLSAEIRADSPLANMALCHSLANVENVFPYMHAKLQASVHLIRRALWQDAKTMLYLPQTREMASMALQINPSALKYVELRDNKDFVISLFDQNISVDVGGLSELLADEQIMHLALSNTVANQVVLRHAHASLQNNLHLVLSSVQASPDNLAFASKELRANACIVKTAVARNGKVLRFASKDLRADRSVVYEAVSENGLALKFASNALRKDMKIAEAALNEKSWKNGFMHALYSLRSNKKFALKAIRLNGCALEHASTKLREDAEVVFEAVLNKPQALKYASKKLKSDVEFGTKVMKALKKNRDRWQAKMHLSCAVLRAFQDQESVDF